MVWAKMLKFDQLKKKSSFTSAYVEEKKHCYVDQEALYINFKCHDPRESFPRVRAWPFWSYSENRLHVFKQ